MVLSNVVNLPNGYDDQKSILQDSHVIIIESAVLCEAGGHWIGTFKPRECT